MVDTNEDTKPRKIPVGIPDLDFQLRGGVPPGTVLLTIGPTGTGVEEFMYSAAVMHGNWQADSDLFELAYDRVEADLHQPNQVHYVSLGGPESQLRQSLDSMAEREWVEHAIDNIAIHDLASPLTELGPVRIRNDGELEYRETGGDVQNPYQGFLRSFGDALVGQLTNSVVFLDQITDLLPLVYKYLDWPDLFFILQTLCYRVAKSNSILIAGANDEFLSRRERALAIRSFNSVLTFDWFGEGGEQRRTIEITKFPEYWRENPAEDRVIFDVEIDRDEFGISSVEKIPPSRIS